MIVHVVLFRPKATVSPEDRKALARAFENAVRTIPSVRRAVVGRRVRPGAGYEALPQPDLQYAAFLEFDDQAGLQAYLGHPAHEEVGRRFFEVMEGGVVFDYELQDGKSVGEIVTNWLD
ncbi:MAG: Dabb family protein [Vicinamibacterales bacterium]|nr:Dabb family protein [Vicinamibacterales bacterium]